MKFEIAECADRKEPFAIIDWHEKTIDAKDMDEAKAIAERTRRNDTTTIIITHNGETRAEWHAHGLTVNANKEIIGEYHNEWIFDLGTPKEDIFAGFFD